MRFPVGLKGTFAAIAGSLLIPAAGVSAEKVHWAFRTIARPQLPAVRGREWARNPIDLFILDRLEAAGLEPSPEAERETLIRRLSLDLLGLLPSPEEVDAFISDPHPDAYERLADRLLASPHHGERWGRHWLDLARYADSNGYTIDGSRSIWKYRDWVIDALNRDYPFDRFVIEQIAGDMLPGASPEQIIATGFHRNTLVNEEGGTDPEQFRVEAVADRVATTGAVFLGLTLGCARCHDHKHDPITQEEFYRMFAFFNNADEPVLKVAAGSEVRKEEPVLLDELAQEEKRLAETDAGAASRRADWERQLAGKLEVEWTVLDPLELRSENGTALERLEDGSLLAGGSIPAGEVYTVVVEGPRGGATAIRLEALPHDRLPRRGPGLAPNGNFVLNELAMTASPGGEAAGAAPVPFSAALADHSQDRWPVAAAIDGKPETGWAINVPSGALNVPRQAVFILSANPGSGPGSRWTFTFTHRHTSPRYALGRFRLSATAADAAAVALPEAVRRALAVPAGERGEAENDLLAREFQKHDKERIPIAERVEELKQRLEQIRRSTTTTLVMRERKEPRTTHVHRRGDFLNPGQQVEPGVPAVLPPLEGSGSAASSPPDRLALARWLVDPRQPLTPRVTVNRLWQHYFGRGIVATENDFGAEGSPPTHPELLDWLAAELVSGGWSLKSIHRLVVTSATYRQSSRARPEAAAVDPTNKLLARQERLRLEAEAIRDAALCAGGLLTRRIGGPGVYPPQPQGIYRFTQKVKSWPESRGEDRYRRGLYTFFWRSSPHPLLSTFDVPDMTVSCTRRARSDTPLQALAIANDSAFHEAARALAGRLLAESPPDDAERIRFAFRLCLSRSPDAGETRILREFLVGRRREAADPESLQTAAPQRLPPGVPPAEGAAWMALARVLFNLDEFITRE